MIYLTKLVLDPGSRSVRELLANPYGVHQRILKAWNGADAGRVLYRLEQLEGDPLSRRAPLPRLLIQAPAPGCWDEAFSGAELREAEEKPVELVLEPEQVLRFYLRANPTRREPGRHAMRPDGRPQDGARRPLVGEEEQRDWLRRKGEACGFAVLALDVTSRGPVYSRKGRGAASTRFITHHCVDFEGRLRVTEPAQLVRAVSEGIGSAKGFGFGLLSLARDLR